MGTRRLRSISRGRIWLASLTALLLAASVVPIIEADPARAQSETLGVDVSHHQEDPPKQQIDWNQVVDSGHVFAFHKATEGATFIDNAYDGNRADAAAVGLPFGAYHFARPEGGTIAAAQTDAIAEAEHFLNVAQPAPGDLVPVLDLETNREGLGANRLIAWTQAWLDTVTAAVDAQPLIYTGPHFWTTEMNDTTTFAAQGFPLWIAHYTSDPPRVPAANWNGNGWSFWQFTSEAEVPGISGRVDENRYPGTDLSPFIIPGGPEPEPTPEPGTPPSNEAPPTISGEPEVGQTLTADKGRWSGTEPISYSYAWFRCTEDGSSCTGIPHQSTEPSYELTPSDYGHRMKVVVTATNGSGSAEEESSPTEVVTDTTAPVSPRLTKPRRERTLKTALKVAWTHPEQQSATYDVRYRSAPKRSRFGDFNDLDTAISRESTTLDATTGTTYCFSARATDTAGNVSGWSDERCTLVPLDDRDLSASSGWSKRTGRAFYLRTFVKTQRAGASLTARNVRVRDIYLIAQRCRGCGTVAVFFNDKRVATVGLGARRTRNKQVIPARSFGSIRRGTVKLVVVSSGAPVKIDGLALSIKR